MVRVEKTKKNVKGMSDKEIVKEYLRKLKAELVMSNYSDGWYVKWVENKIKEIESRDD